MILVNESFVKILEIISIILKKENIETWPHFVLQSSSFCDKFRIQQ